LTFQDITHPDDLAEDLALAQKLLTSELANYSLEKRYLRKGGGQTWIRLTAKLTRDRREQPWFFAAVIENIHDRKLAEEDRR
jgi:PAS domain S-box-containing protein